MQIDIRTVIVLLIVHFIADFVLQTDKQAQGKSKNWSCLLEHTGTYSACFAFPVLLLFGQNMGQTCSWYVIHTLLFVGVTFIVHTVQDYITSRINSKLWVEKKTHLFFVSIGFDQLLHVIQLLFTYQLLWK